MPGRPNLELELARRLDKERSRIAADARKAADEEHQLELREKDLLVEQMQRQIKDLEESSDTRAGLIGEAQEREIEDVLKEKFRSDKIEPVKSGMRGADVLQSVFSNRDTERSRSRFIPRSKPVRAKVRAKS